jgi:hypothetical protein
VTPALKLSMGIHAMVRFTVRVAALAAVAALLLQPACAAGFTEGTHLHAAAPAESGCHETEPATPSTPAPVHVCCGGDHSPDALLTTAYLTALPMVSQKSQSPAFHLSAARLLIPVADGPSSSPPGPLVLRI